MSSPMIPSFARAEAHCISAMQIILVAEPDSVTVLPLRVNVGFLTSSICHSHPCSYVRLAGMPYHAIMKVYKLVNKSWGYWIILQESQKGLFVSMLQNSGTQPVEHLEFVTFGELLQRNLRSSDREGPKSEYLVQTLILGHGYALLTAHCNISIDSTVVYFSLGTYGDYPIPASTS